MLSLCSLSHWHARDGELGGVPLHVGRRGSDEAARLYLGVLLREGERPGSRDINVHPALLSYKRKRTPGVAVTGEHSDRVAQTGFADEYSLYF